MTMQIAIDNKIPRYKMEIYTSTLKKEPFDSFLEGLVGGDLCIYGKKGSGKTSMLLRHMGTPVTTQKALELAYYWYSAVAYKDIHDFMTSKVTKNKAKEDSESKQKVLYELRPEIIGLGLGAIVSLGVGIFALVTRNMGLATVMGGPFLATILGFSLLFLGTKRGK